MTINKIINNLTKRYLCSLVNNSNNSSNISTNNNIPRLARVIASTGIFSRRQAEKIILDGRVKVNYKITTTVTQEVYLNDKILIDDIEVNLGYQVDRPKLWMAYKLRGEIVANQDPALNRPVMFSRFKVYMEDTQDLKAINKLEINTEGLQLLTNSPLLARILENSDEKAPQFVRKYRVRVHGKLTPSKLDALTRGLNINGVKYKPITPTFERTTGVVSWLTLTCVENKSRFLRNIFEHLLLQITRVIATQFGPYKIPKDLTPGSIREIQLTPDIEKLYLKEITKRMPKIVPKSKVGSKNTSKSNSNNDDNDDINDDEEQEDNEQENNENNDNIQKVIT